MGCRWNDGMPPVVQNAVECFDSKGVRHESLGVSVYVAHGPVPCNH